MCNIIKTKRIIDFEDSLIGELNEILTIGVQIKDGENDSKNFEDFKNKIEWLITKRKLSISQLHNSYFAYKTKRSMNFYVPSSGKTTTVLSTFFVLKKIDFCVNNLVVIGPKNCFKSWIDEYFECTGTKPLYITSEDVKKKHFDLRESYLKRMFREKECIFLNYEFVNKHKNSLVNIVNEKTFLVYDEVHKIKRKMVFELMQYLKYQKKQYLKLHLQECQYQMDFKICIIF